MWSRIFIRSFSSESLLQSVKKRNTIRRLISQPEAEVPKLAKHREFPVIAACVAESFEFSKLLPFLQRNFILSPFICDDVLHVQIPQVKNNSLFPHAGEIFFFRNGSLVYWSQQHANDSESALDALKSDLLPQLKPFEQTIYPTADFEEMNYRQGTGIK